MIYCDSLYGYWELPDFIKRLIHTKEMVRARNINQAVIPNCLIPYGPIQNRFQHGMGVCILSQIVLDNNPSIADKNILLPVAGVLHDVGNTCLSHMGEIFLKEFSGKDGESFLENILSGSETETILHDIGIKTEDVVKMVTGKAGPISEVLNGSIDIDNLDNIGRYDQCGNLGVPKFNAKRIASSFRFQNSKWILKNHCKKNVQEWKKARELIYSRLYTEPHLNLATMIYRALEIAWRNGLINQSFFLLDDYEAIKYLATKCGFRSSYLVDKALRWEWFEEAFGFVTEKPSEKLEKEANLWRSRMKPAEKICSKLDIPGQKIAVCLQKGKEKRKITLPFVSDNGNETHDDSPNEAIYRIKVYVPSHLLHVSKKIADIVSEEYL